MDGLATMRAATRVNAEQAPETGNAEADPPNHTALLTALSKVLSSTQIPPYIPVRILGTTSESAGLATGPYR